jgi:hypothetical protein
MARLGVDVLTVVDWRVVAVWTVGGSRVLDPVHPIFEDDVTVPPAGQAGFAAQVRRLARSLYSAVPGERECSDVFTVSGSCPDGQRTAIEVPGDGYSPLSARRIRGTRS